METFNKYYTYFHINPITNEVFYVGKGCDGRAYDTKGRNKYWKRYVKKYGIKVQLVDILLSEERAYELEKQYIKHFGVDSLTNIHTGGINKSYTSKSNEFKEKERSKSRKKLNDLADKFMEKILSDENTLEYKIKKFIDSSKPDMFEKWK